VETIKPICRWQDQERQFTFNQQAKLPVRLPNADSGVVSRNSPRRLSITCAAAFLVLGGCSTYEAGTPETAANYHEPAAAKTENRCLEQVTKDPLPSLSALALH
jgi:hypothetical protein